MVMASMGRRRLPAGESALRPAAMKGTQTTRLRSPRPWALHVMTEACALAITSPRKGTMPP
ncbi:hypothetical protein D3C72_1282320 [compost metagenome]